MGSSLSHMSKTERRALERSISPVVFSEQEYDMNAKMASPFSLAIREEGVALS